MTLERSYRWLLACYPWEYRREYAEELLGVLLDDAAPQQRRPRVREVVDLLGGALRAHFRYAGTRLSDPSWRHAAAILGLLAPLVMFAYTVRLPLLDLSVTGRADWAQFAPPLVWLVVAVPAAIGWHRTAAVLAWPAAALEVFRTDGQYGYLSMLHLWPVALAVLAAVALTVAGPRPGAALLGRGRLALLAGATLLVGGAPTIAVGALSSASIGDGGNLRTSWIFTNNVNYPEAVLLSAGYACGLLAVLSLDATLRRRVLALLVPVGVIFLITRFGIGVLSLTVRPTEAEVPVGLHPGQWLLVALVSVSTLAVAVAVVHRRERSLRILAQEGSGSRLADGDPPRRSAPHGGE